MSAMHGVDRGDFDALAAGGQTIGAVRMIRSIQASRRILLLGAVARFAKEHALAAFVENRVDESLDLLVWVHRRVPGAVTDVLLQPQVGTWAARCLRGLRGAGPVEDLGYLTSLAAVAALRGRLDVDVSVALRNGTLTLPGFGSALLNVDERWGRARVGAGGTHA
jgi:HEXXH motif-containing protein